MSYNLSVVAKVYVSVSLFVTTTFLVHCNLKRNVFSRIDAPGILLGIPSVGQDVLMLLLALFFFHFFFLPPASLH